MLRTDRVWLRPLEPADAPALHEAYTDAETMEWWHLPVATALLLPSISAAAYATTRS